MRRINDRPVQALNDIVAPVRIQTRSDAAYENVIDARRGNTMKTILITLAIVGTLGILLCAGLGAAAYFWLQRNMANLSVTDPIRIRELTAEMVDVTLPKELVPHNAASIFGSIVVVYYWCPTGTCGEQEASVFTLVSIPEFGNPKDNPIDQDQESDESLKQRFQHFTKTVHEIEIRGTKYPFTFVFGDLKDTDESADDELDVKPMEDDSSKPDANEPVAGEPKSVELATPEAATPVEGPKVGWVSGNFPGKKGRCNLTMQLTADHYDETKILEMLRSIR